uniref:OPA3-like protein n=1 Tax=Chenopodium quinoa TaxID=63459 RepID=A0A803LLP1_CHEQI
FRNSKAMVFPVIKIGTLALRTLSKPIATRLKQQAGLHPKFRELIISLAQANHRLTTTLQRRIYGHATDVEIRPLNQERAVQAASDLLGEMFIFLVAGAAVIFEVQRSAKSEAKKEEKRLQELEALRQKNEDLYKEMEQLKHKLVEIEKLAKGQGIAGIFNFRFFSQSGTEKSAQGA